MKKILTLLLTIISITLVSCIDPIDIKNSMNIDYEVVDTTYIFRRDFLKKGNNRRVIIKIDSSYYSAHMTQNGNVTKIYMKLNIKACGYKKK